jgi:hypothetical protein
VQLVIDLNVPARIDFDPSLVEPETVRIRTASDRNKQMRTDHFRTSLRGLDLNRDAVSLAGNRRRLGAEADRDSLLRQDLGDLREISSSSRATSRGSASITVTALPNRRYICANSSPM